jgi:hypothetical protein
VIAGGVWPIHHLLQPLRQVAAGRCLEPHHQLFSLWRSGIKSQTIASLVFASNPLGEAGSWLIRAL